MAFTLSPGVSIVEKDLTNVVPAVSTSAGAFAAPFAWGPVLDPVLITSENELAARFGKPVDGNAASWFTAANFLAYSNRLQTVRVATAGARNAVETPASAGNTIVINNEQDYLSTYADGTADVGLFAAKYPGTLGNSIGVFMADSATFGGWTATINSRQSNEVTLNLAALFDSAPSTSNFVANVGGSNDELHVVVIDTLGLWTGVTGAVLEKFSYVSKALNARKSDGGTNFYKDVINTQSKYVWWMDYPVAMTNWGTDATGKEFTVLGAASASILSGGADDFDADDGDYQDGYAIFQNAEELDVSLIPAGAVSGAVAKWIVDNVAETRKDCVVFVSPRDVTTNEVITGSNSVEKIIEFRTNVSFNVNSSYAVMDSGYKYQYDRYNDKYRWVPLNGDIAGLCARTDYTNDSWWSPGGLNRGQVKNVVKLAFNPNQAQRDELYKAGVNPVVSLRGQGVVLFGDKTLLAKPSAFDRINVRRLFIALEKAIATAAQYQLFEFNDAFTRAQFRSMVEPFLRDVQGRRGITDFRVVCDETNNTGEVIDQNRFVASIFVKPNRSINHIELSFVAVRTGISFDEISG